MNKKNLLLMALTAFLNATPTLNAHKAGVSRSKACTKNTISTVSVHAAKLAGALSGIKLAEYAAMHYVPTLVHSSALEAEMSVSAGLLIATIAGLNLGHGWYNTECNDTAPTHKKDIAKKSAAQYIKYALLTSATLGASTYLTRGNISAARAAFLCGSVVGGWLRLFPIPAQKVELDLQVGVQQV